MSDRAYSSLSLDLDNKWSYLQTHGDDAWTEFPSYLGLVVPRILEFLRRRDLRITFFVVGQDAALAPNREALSMLVPDGHEVASHSFHHRPWLHLYSEDEIDAELAQAETHIAAACGQKPVGFRGPGFSISSATLRVLLKRGYLYDATSFPNLLNPLARAYFFSHSNLSEAQKEQRKALFGTWSDALRPNDPFHWEIDGRKLLEIPVTTFPFVKVPIHFSYLLYLGSYSRLAAVSYFRLALAVCRISGTAPSLLLHPLDFLGVEDDADLAFFPGMSMPLDRKLDMLEQFFDLLQKRFEPVSMSEHVRRASSAGSLRQLVPRFSQVEQTR